MSSIMRARSALTGRCEEWEVIGGLLSRAEGCWTFDARERMPRSSRLTVHAFTIAAENASTATQPPPARAGSFLGPKRTVRGCHRLVHDMNIGGEHVVVRSERPVPAGERRLGVRMRRLSREATPTMETGLGVSEFTLMIDGAAAGRIETRLGFYSFISWTGLDIGRDRGSP